MTIDKNISLQIKDSANSFHVRDFRYKTTGFLYNLKFDKILLTSVLEFNSDLTHWKKFYK